MRGKKNKTQFNLAHATKMLTKTKTIQITTNIFRASTYLVNKIFSTKHNTKCDKESNMNSQYCALRFMLAFDAQFSISCSVYCLQ